MATMQAMGQLRGLDEVVAVARHAAEREGRAWITDDDIGLVLMSDLAQLVRSFGIDVAAWNDLVAQYLRPVLQGDHSDGLHKTAEELLALAHEEADRASDGATRAHAGHLLAALLTVDGSTVAANARYLRLTAAKVRDAFGWPAHRRAFAEGCLPSDHRRPARARYVLLGGGPRMADVLPTALDQASRWAGVSLADLRVAVVGATNRYGAANDTRRLRRLGVDAFDAGVHERADAQASGDRLGAVDAVYVTGGDHAQGADRLIGTPFVSRLAELAERGVVLMGHSAGASIWGASTVSWFVSQGEPEPLPMLGWLDYVVVAHHLPDSPRLPDARRHHPTADIIALAHEGAVAIDEDGSITELVRGETDSLVVRNGVTSKIGS